MSTTLPVGTPARAGDHCVDGSLGVTGTTSTNNLTVADTATVDTLTVADVATLKDIAYTGTVFTGTDFTGTSYLKIDIGGDLYRIRLTPDA